jgi:PKHD-type hydroxylase
MQYILSPFTKGIEPWIWQNGVFSEEELDLLQERAKNSNQRASVSGNLGSEDLAKIRRSHVSWVSHGSETDWIFRKLANVVSSVNAEHYGFDLTGFGENLQLTNYDQSEQGMYGWHQDCGSKSISRKLSLVLQLTDPSEYEGGNLQIKTNSEIRNVRKERGLIAIFPSFQLHQVTPVTQGSRQSLVAWITGPAFR